VEIRPLRPEDDRSVFSCGDPDYDSFLKKYAGQNQFTHYIGHTAVAVLDGVVAGYVTYAAGAIEFDEIPEGTRRRLPAYPLPILRLARLAVDERFSHQGLGRELVRYAFTMALVLRDEFGCVGVVVDALQDRTGFCGDLGFVAIEVVEGESAIRPQPVPMFLPIADIAAALGSGGQ
jgi:GNAT superfamily N-acetyltransferase